MNFIARGLGRRMAGWLSRPVKAQSTSPPADLEQLAAVIKPGDVLLVEGESRISVAIKYLTQSTWSHAALYVGPQGTGSEVSATQDIDARAPAFLPSFIEADIEEGVRLVGIAEYSGLHCRICRPVDLQDEDLQALLDYALARIGVQYDLKNVVDLARYLIPTPPVPVRWRRKMLAFGSGDPTRAICSTLIAQCFQSIRYPILPQLVAQIRKNPECAECIEDIYQLRHHSLFVPRDFDVSPYFDIIKPSLALGFEYKSLLWVDGEAGTGDGVGL